ncbi:MAG TPA: glycosyltransferase family 39 protein [Anaerolineae bacterium]
MKSLTAARNAPPLTTLARILWSLVWLALIIYLILTLWLGLTGVVYPYQLDYGEGIVLWFARQIAHGHSIYKGLTGYPYASSNYPPVSMVLSAILMPVLGEGYAGGRLLNFASALVVAGLIYRIVRLRTRRRWTGMIAALMFAGSPYIYHWVPLFRADLIGLAFAFGGIYCIWMWERKSDHRNALLAVAVLLFLLALYTKQTLFAGPVAAFLALWMRDHRLAVRFAVLLGAVGGAIYLVTDVLTGGALTFGLITSNATVFLSQQLFELLGNFTITFPILILFALWGLVKRYRDRRIGVVEWYTVISLAALAMAGRTGAWENYFFEAIAALCVVALSDLPLKGLGAKYPPFASFLSEPLIPFLLLVQTILMWHDPRVAVDLMARDLPANRQLAALLAQTSSPILSEDMGALVTSGKEVAYYTFQYSSLARSHQWDQSWELNGLRDGVFPLVILEHGTREDIDHYRRFTREFVSFLDRYYDRVQMIGKYEVYAPAPPLVLASADFGDALGLVGWSAQPETLKAGTLKLAIVWQAKRTPERNYKAFVQLERIGAGKVTQDDHEPRLGAYPTTHWAAGEMVREVYTLQVPGNLPVGQYIVRAGWYDSETEDRLEVPGSADNSAVLATYEVK